jgi:hypothetical protein
MTMWLFTCSPFQEDTLKDWLRVISKYLKTNITNEEGTEKAIVQSNEVLAQLKAMDNLCATRNVFKER